MSWSGLSDGRAGSLAAALPAGPAVISGRVHAVSAGPLGPRRSEEAWHAGEALWRPSETIADRE
eukprot:2415742-Alexandrium_andersonii.AAC.1